MSSSFSLNISKILSLFVCFGGSIVIIGWIYDLEMLKSILPIWVTMKVSTAHSFILSGITLFFCNDSLEKRPDLSHIVLSFTSLLILLMMFTLLIGSIFGLHSGIEEMFVPETFQQESGVAILSTAPGVPSIGTMVNFVLIAACGILALYFEKKPVALIRKIGFVVLIVGFVALLGYLFSYPYLYFLIPGYSSAMAVHTAILFVVCGAGFILIKKV